MTEYLLRTEIGETLTNRQMTKIEFLEQEVAQYRQKIRDLEMMLHLNKQALELAYRQNQLPISNSHPSNSLRKRRKQVSFKLSIWGEEWNNG